MTENQLLELYRTDKPMLEALGKIVVDAISNSPQLRSLSASFFLLPPQSRTKSEESVLQKAFYREKQYSNPYEDITDKVGVRFVMLTVDQVRLLKGVVEGLAQFDKSLDRDFEEERRKNPTTFAYQSVHYVLRPKLAMTLGRQSIRPGLPCEVQLRTLLQHAYSELTHDTIYKPKAFAEPEVHRLAARSMALIETTDEIFCQAISRFEQFDRSMDPLISHIVSTYSAKLTFHTEPKLNAIILDSMRTLLKVVTQKSLEDFVTKHDYVIDRVKERANAKLLYRQPVILLLYLLVATSPAQVSKYWPFLSEDLDPIFADLGISRSS